MSYLPKDQFLVMTKESMLMLIEPGKTLEDCVGECEIETGRLINADWIVTGEILRFGSSYRVSLRLHDTRKGQFIKGESIKGDRIESLENPLHISSLRFVYQISPDLKERATQHWGSDLNTHLKKLRDGVGILYKKPRTRARARVMSRPAPGARKREVYKSAQKPVNTSSDSDQSFVGFTVNVLGLLQYGPEVSLEFGKQTVFNVFARPMQFGLATYLTFESDKHEQFNSGYGGGAGIRFYSDRQAARRGGYFGVNIEYLLINTEWTETGYRHTNDVTAYMIEPTFGYRWVSDDFTVGVGAWVGYYKTLKYEVTYTDDYNWEGKVFSAGEVENREDSGARGGLTLEMGWLL